MKGRTLLAAAGALLCVAASSAHAQSDARPIRLVVPFPPGAGTDAVARVIAVPLAEELGQPIIVDNRSGASGAIGAHAVAQSEPDGQTLLFVASPFTTVAAAGGQPRYDPVGEFRAIGLIATGPLVLVVAPSLPVQTLADLLRLARERPGLLNYGSAGSGGVNHLFLERLKRAARVDIVHIPYKGIGPAITDLLGGSLQMLTATVPAVVPHARQGRMRALAVTGPQRVAQLAEVPTLAEAGLTGIDALNYWGLVGPARLPVAQASRLHAALARVLARAAVRERLEREGVVLSDAGPEAFAKFLAADFAGWRKVVTAAGINLGP